MMNDADWTSILTNEDMRAGYERYLGEANRALGALLEYDLRGGGEPADRALPLANMPFVVKDNIAVKGFRLTCGSKILEGYRAPYTATAVAKLQRAGALVIGKANLDEFGMGSSTWNSALAETFNPWNTDLSPGGSSGGTAVAVAAGMAAFGLGSDTGGSVRQPAAFCGIYGLKPTYGAVSRYGLVSYASSLEVIGAMAGSVGLLRRVFEAMRGPDDLDQTTLPDSPNRDDRAATGVRRIGVLRSLDGVMPEISDGYRETAAGFRGLGYRIVNIDLPLMDYVAPAYYTIASAEASANLARYDGVRYGLSYPDADDPEQLMRIARSRGFGREVKLRILAGVYVLRSGFQDRFYHRAQKIRTAIRQGMEELFGSVDAILLPVFPTLPFARGEAGLDSFQQKQADLYTATANLSALPALSFPAAMAGGLPIGMQIMAPPLCEERLFRMAEDYGNHFPPRRPPDFPGIVPDKGAGERETSG